MTIDLAEYMNEEASNSDFDEDIEELEEGVDDKASSFTIDDYEKEEPSNEEEAETEKEEDDSEKTIENNENEVNKRSVSEPTTTKHSLPEDVANLQKRAFSLSTRPVSKLDPGIYGYGSSANNSKTMLPEESDVESEYESEEEETTVIDETGIQWPELIQHKGC